MENKTHHTPGIWETRGNGIYSGDLYLAAVYAPASHGARPLNEESEANARLIAAAPDLLAALKRAETLLAIAFNPGIEDSLTLTATSCQHAANAARLAIAKAEGGLQ